MKDNLRLLFPEIFFLLPFKKDQSLKLKKKKKNPCLLLARDDTLFLRLQGLPRAYGITPRGGSLSGAHMVPSTTTAALGWMVKASTAAPHPCASPGGHVLRFPVPSRQPREGYTLQKCVFCPQGSFERRASI